MLVPEFFQAPAPGRREITNCSKDHFAGTARSARRQSADKTLFVQRHEMVEHVLRICIWQLDRLRRGRCLGLDCEKDAIDQIRITGHANVSSGSRAQMRESVNAKDDGTKPPQPLSESGVFPVIHSPDAAVEGSEFRFGNPEDAWAVVW
jgi:hypothetical protein